MMHTEYSEQRKGWSINAERPSVRDREWESQPWHESMIRIKSGPIIFITVTYFVNVLYPELVYVIGEELEIKITGFTNKITYRGVVKSIHLEGVSRVIELKWELE